MKKFNVILAAIILLAASCTKVEPVLVPEREKDIDFTVANYMTQTKADGSKFDTAKHFGTFGWKTTDGSAYMNNVEIAYSTSAKCWKAVSGTYTWRAAQSSLDFVSYYPFSATPWCSFNSAKNVITSTQTLDNNTTTDLMYSDKVCGISQNINRITDNAIPESGFTGVPTLFHHALARVAFNVNVVRTDDSNDGDRDIQNIWDVTLKSVSVKNVAQTGSLSMSLNTPSGSAPQIVTWNAPTTWTVAETAAAHAGTLNYSVAGVTAGTAYMNVIPQSLDWSATASERQTLDVEFEISLYNAENNSLAGNFDHDNMTGSPVLKYTVKRSIVLKSSSTDGRPAAWAMNTLTTYTINIDPVTDEILFAPSVDSWDNVAGETTIQ